MNYLRESHSQFINDLITSSKLDENFYTILPTVYFLSGSFILLFVQLHRFTSSLTRWKTQLYRELLFHWAFFYVSRVWFLFIKICRWSVHALDEIVEKNVPQEDIYYNQVLTHLCIFIIVSIIGLIPIMVLSVKQIYTRNIPNFLMWVGEDPWLRSEIGTSGHYLERPPRVPVYGNKKSAYRSRRSTSVDTNIFNEPPVTSVMQV